MHHLRRNSACSLCALITVVSILTVGISLRYSSDLSDPNSFTERASDDQCLGPSNNTASVAKLPSLRSKPYWSLGYFVAIFLI